MVTGCAQQPLVPVRVSTPSGEVIEGGGVNVGKRVGYLPEPCLPTVSCDTVLCHERERFLRV